jgi:glutamyl-tRNA synthetase
MAKPVVTRFAPSPTGTLHIGGARTALFNWLYARHTRGKFLLRIEDTDRERSKPEHVDAILNSLKWLELDWDGEPLFQFARADRHREVARRLLAEGKAYNCYLTPDELKLMQDAIAAERDLAKQEKRAPRGPQKIESPWRDRDPKEAPPGIKPALRLRAPREGETVVDDKVQGRVVVQNTQLDDMIILRSDGAPTYNFAVVVDDHDMGVTHVIRGSDHLNNASRQTQVYLACGWELPEFAHIPLIHGPDGAKLSKRHGAQSTEEYRALGYLPAGLRNYLVRLGWSHGDDEIISTDQLVEWFDIDGINKSAARYDIAKLDAVNAHYIKTATPAELVRRLKEALPEMPNGPALSDAFTMAGWERVQRALPSLQTRAKTLVELVAGMEYLTARRPPDEKAKAALDADGKSVNSAVRTLLETLPATDWNDPANLEAPVKAWAEARGLKLGKVAAPLRAGLTGRSVSPPIFDVMMALGREETLARLAEHAA